MDIMNDMINPVMKIVGGMKINTVIRDLRIDIILLVMVLETMVEHLPVMVDLHLGGSKNAIEDTNVDIMVVEVLIAQLECNPDTDKDLSMEVVGEIHREADGVPQVMDLKVTEDPVILEDMVHDNLIMEVDWEVRDHGEVRPEL